MAPLCGHTQEAKRDGLVKQKLEKFLSFNAYLWVGSRLLAQNNALQCLRPCCGAVQHAAQALQSNKKNKLLKGRTPWSTAGCCCAWRCGQTLEVGVGSATAGAVSSTCKCATPRRRLSVRPISTPSVASESLYGRYVSRSPTYPDVPILVQNTIVGALLLL